MEIQLKYTGILAVPIQDKMLQILMWKKFPILNFYWVWYLSIFSLKTKWLNQTTSTVPWNPFVTIPPLCKQGTARPLMYMELLFFCKQCTARPLYVHGSPHLSKQDITHLNHLHFTLSENRLDTPQNTTTNHINKHPC